MQTRRVDIWRTYLDRIEQSVGSTLFQHLFVKEDETVRDVTQGGELSCALHVSSVLAMVGLIDRPHATVGSTLRALENAGWTPTPHPAEGALVVWPAGRDGHEHIGFYLNEHQAVSNSTTERVPVRHALAMKDGRTPRLFLTYPPELLTPDTRNVQDMFRGRPVEQIVAQLDISRSELEIAVENIERDFNMGTIIRTANAFNVRKVHIIGRRQWNKRGAMKTDAYLHLAYYQTPAAFFEEMERTGRFVVAMDVVGGAASLGEVQLPASTVLVFGAEGPGLSTELLQGAAQVVQIEQFGSTRSVNVGVAAGIAMYAWMQQHRLRSNRSA